jgi:hypothetical protein
MSNLMRAWSWKRVAFLSVVGSFSAWLAACSSSASNSTSSGGTDAGGAAGAGGTAGAAGSGGTTPDAGDDASDAGPVASLCTLTCANSDDCKSNGVDLGLVCGASGSCLSCTGNGECTRILSQWYVPCTGDADCLLAKGGGWVCIDADGSGRCAKAAPVSTAEPCAAPDPPDRMTRTRVGSTGSVDVCGYKSVKCDQAAGTCELVCTNDDFCLAYVPHSSTCDVTSGKCACAGASDCAGSPLGPVCVAGHCGCSGDADCDVSGDAGANGSKCVAGVCSCAGVGECKFGDKPFDGVAWSCEPVQ